MITETHECCGVKYGAERQFRILTDKFMERYKGKKGWEFQ